MRPHLKLPDLKKHTKRAGKQVVRVLRALEQEDDARIVREIERYLRSYSVRVVAADYVHHRAKEGDRFQTIEEFEKVVESVDMFKPIGEPVVLSLIPKRSDGDFRLIQSFTIRQKIAQRVIDMLLREIGRTHPEQFAMRGGVNAAVSHVETLLNGKENAWIAHLDIQNAYGHVNRTNVEELIPLPLDVVREHMFVSPSSDIHTNSTKLTPPEGSDPSVTVEQIADLYLRVRDSHGGVRSGLSQGAICAPIVLEILIASDLFELNLTEFSNYADNFCVVASSREELMEKVKALRAKLKANPCGPFHLESLFFGEARQGFDFLGYHLRLRKGKVDIRPADNNLQKIENEFGVLIRKYNASSLDERRKLVERFERDFRQRTASFSQATDMEGILRSKRRVVERLEKQLKVQIVEQENKMKEDPYVLDSEVPF